ncbi:glycosyltransferase [Lachnospiraceae bacterium 62-35]
MANILMQCLWKKDSAPAIALSMAKGFADNAENHVYCIISDQISNKSQWIQDSRLNIYTIDTGNQKSFVQKSLYLKLVEIRRLKTIFSGIEFHISIQPFVHPWGNIINNSLQAAHKIGICHDPNPHTGEKFINKFFSEYGYRSTNELIALTKQYIQPIYKKYGKPVYYMRHGLFSSYRNIACDISFYDSENINFLFFGRIEEYKGIDMLLKAYSNICQKYDKVSLTIAGNGDMSQYRESIIACKNINIINRYIEDSEIAPLFSGENLIVILPYLEATQSGVIPIAIDFNVPIIASNTSGLVEQLDRGRIGKIFETGNIDELTLTMQYAIENPSFCEEEKRKMKTYTRELEWNFITNKLLDDVQNSRFASMRDY